jgi:hypothetical protein
MLQAALPAHFVNIDDDTPLLLPPDLRDWLTKDHLVHFIMDAVAQIDVSGAKVNERGTGSEKYPPAMMMSLLIFCCGPAHRHQRLCRHQTHASPAQRARPGKARLPARADARSQRQRAHGPPHPHRSRARLVQTASANHRIRLRHHQKRDGVPQLQHERTAESRTSPRKHKAAPHHTPARQSATHSSLHQRPLRVR